MTLQDEREALMDVIRMECGNELLRQRAELLAEQIKASRGACQGVSRERTMLLAMRRTAAMHIELAKIADMCCRHDVSIPEYEGLNDFSPEDVPVRVTDEAMQQPNRA